jgi:hypothetical protein
MKRPGFAAFLQIFFLIFLVQTTLIFSEENQTDENNIVNGSDESSLQEAETEELSKTDEEKIENKEVIAPKPVFITNQGVQKQLNEQYRWTPEDPSFLYETRYIPGIKITEEFLPVELEKEVIKERIAEEKNFTKSLEKIQIRLPDVKQTIVIVGLIIIILIYRTRVKRPRR